MVWSEQCSDDEHGVVCNLPPSLIVAGMMQPLVEDQVVIGRRMRRVMEICSYRTCGQIIEVNPRCDVEESASRLWPHEDKEQPGVRRGHRARASSEKLKGKKLEQGGEPKRPFRSLGGELDHGADA